MEAFFDIHSKSKSVKIIELINDARRPEKIEIHPIFDRVLKTYRWNLRNEKNHPGATEPFHKGTEGKFRDITSVGHFVFLDSRKLPSPEVELNPF